MDLRERMVGEGSTSSRHPWEKARARVITYLIKKYLPLTHDSHIMDLGCGDTFVTEYLANHFPSNTFYAVDTAFTEELLHIYRNRLSDKRIVIASSLEQLWPIASSSTTQDVPSMQLILLTDVIEHIEHDIQFIRELISKDFITKHTLFLITVPAFQVLFCSHDVFLGHYRRYTRMQLLQHLYEGGLLPIESGYFFFSLLPIRLLQKIKEKWFSVTKPEEKSLLTAWKGGNNLNRILEELLYVDARILFLLGNIGLKIPGLSAYAICRKQ